MGAEVMTKLHILDTLQAAHNEYFNLLIKNYPTLPSEEPFADFGPPELCQLALEVQSCVIALGPTALGRFVHIGLEVLYPFDNPVDIYNWRQHVRNDRIEHTTYASIAIRIDAEIKRLRRTLELGDETAYNALTLDVFLVAVGWAPPTASLAKSQMASTSDARFLNVLRDFECKNSSQSP